MAEEALLSQWGANLSVGAPSNFSRGGPDPAAKAPTTVVVAALAAALALLSLLGNALLLLRLLLLRGPRRKMDFLVAHLALADLYGSGFLLLSPFLFFSPFPDGSCRLLSFLRGSGKLAPSHMVLLIAWERRSLLRSPSTASPRGALAGLGWLLALLLALPEAFAFRPLDGGCLSVFPHRPRWQGAAYSVYGAVVSFVAPACLLGFLLWSLGRRREPKPGLEGEPQPSRVLRRVFPSPPRTRAVQLSLALAALFALCGLPRCLLELAAAAGEEGASTAADLLAASPAALNPLLCLFFRSHRRRRFLFLCPKQQRPQQQQPRRRHHHRSLRKRKGGARNRNPAQAQPQAPPLWLCWPCQEQPREEGAGPVQEPGSSGL